MKPRFTFLLIALVAGAISARAQSPAPVVIQAIMPGQPAAAKTTSADAAPAFDSSAAVLRALQQMKATNEEILAKQAAALQQLEDIDKAAEQLRIYNKRG